MNNSSERSGLRVLLIHNAYGKPSGEESVLEFQSRLLREKGHCVEEWFRCSSEIHGWKGNLSAFLGGVYNLRAGWEMKRRLAASRPDLVHIHNLYPLFSPSILRACREAGVPVVMTVHNYRMVCPTGLFFMRREICHRCAGPGREWNCAWRNCTGQRVKSVGYALRGWAARRFQWFHRGVTRFLALTEFQRDTLVQSGFAPARIGILPNAWDGPADPHLTDGAYVAYAGRLSPEKGIDLLAEAAHRMPEIPFRVAGGIGHQDPHVSFPPNVTCTGSLSGEALRDHYRRAALVVIPSRFYEGLPMVAIEAMAWHKPVIGPRHGGFPEVIQDGQTGLLFRPGEPTDLAAKIQSLWHDSALRHRLSAAARQRYLQLYTPEVYYRRLMEEYAVALGTFAGGPAPAAPSSASN